MHDIERLMNEIQALIEKNPNTIMIRSFPDWNDKIFKELKALVSAFVALNAEVIIRGHLDARSKGRAISWLGARPPLDAKEWSHNNFVTVYYLRCQPSA